MEFRHLDRPSERRARARMACEAPVAVTAGEASLDGQITDFSASGLRVEFPARDDAATRLQVGETATLSLPADASKVTADRLALIDGDDADTSATRAGAAGSIDATIVHSSASAVGLTCAELPQAWQLALGRSGRSGRDVSPSASSADAVVGAATPALPVAPPDGETRVALLARCQRTYAEALRSLVAVLLERTALRLATAEAADPFLAARSGYADARHSLATLRNSALERCAPLADARFGDDDAAANDDWAAQSAATDLRLLDADELEDFLAVGAIVKASNDALRSAINAGEARWIGLRGHSVAFGRSPLAPAALLRDARAAAGVIPLNGASVRVLLGELAGIAVEHCRALLSSLSQILSTVPPAARTVAPTRLTAHTSDATDTRADTPDAGFAPAARVSAAADASVRRALTATQSEPLASAPTIPPTGAPRALGVLGDLAQALAGAPPQTARNGEQASTTDVLAALDAVAFTEGAVFADSPIDEIRNALQTRSATLSGAQQHILETSGLLFRQAGKSLVASGDVEVLVKRLERTLLKLAIRDGEFPASPDHAGRQVLNLIEQYNFAANDQGQLLDAKLRQHLESLVSRLCQQADQHPEVFATVRENLAQDVARLRRERRERVDRTVEAFESRDRVRVARSVVDGVLLNRLTGRKLPRLLLRLLDEVWRQHAVLIVLRFGPESEPWRQSQRLIEHTLAVATHGLDDPATQALRSAVCRDLTAVLSAAVNDLPMRETLARQLRALLVEADAALASDLIAAPEFRQAASPPGNPPLAGHDIGSWWSHGRDAGGIALQLVWRSEETGHLGFVNRSATQRLELTVDEFNVQAQRGEIRERENLDIPLLDRSEAILLDQMYADAVRRSDQDSNTGVWNRRGLLKRLREHTTTGTTGQHHVLLLLEFDQCRAVAAACGVEAADRLTRELLAGVRAASPDNIDCALYRDDVAAVLLPNHTLAAATPVAESLRQRLGDYAFAHEQQSYRIGVSIGIVEFVSGQTSEQELLRRADTACLAARSGGRNSARVYQTSDQDVRSEESLIRWAGQIDSLFTSERLYLRAQAVMPVTADAHKLPGYELLLGIEPDDSDPIAPYDFVLALQRLGRAHELDIWVAQQALRWMRDNAAILDRVDGIAVNLSVASLTNPEVLHFLREALQQPGTPANKLVLEITESAAIHNFAAAEAFIGEMHGFGVRFSLDDFGSGYTSYAHLKRLSVDTIKIDGSYILDIDESDGRTISERDVAIVRSMTDVAHTLGMKVVAEWVESTTVLERLVALGIDCAQGYAVHRPVRLTDLLAGGSAADECLPPLD